MKLLAKQLLVLAVGVGGGMLFPGAARASQLSLGAVTGYNIFTLSNFSEAGTDAWGRVAVGGNFTPAGGGSFAVATQISDPASTFDLVVGGSMTNGSVQNITGSVAVAGPVNWQNASVAGTLYSGGAVTTSGSSATLGGLDVAGNFSTSSITMSNGANAYVSGTFTAGSGSGSGTIYAGTYAGPNYLTHAAYSSGSAPAIPTPINFLTAGTQLQSLTTAIDGLAQNGTVAATSNSLTLTGTDAAQNVFNITSAQLDAALASGASGVSINVPGTSTVVINVSGATVTAVNSQMNLNGLSADNVLWNFSNVTAFNTTNFAWYGTVIAPEATFTGSSGQFNGQLVTNTATGSTEFHNYLFTGTITAAATPEPGTWLTMLGGLGVLGAGLMRRKNSAR